MKIKVLHQQSLLDLAIQHTGSVINAYAIAMDNDMAISDALVPGQSIDIPEVEKDQDILNYYQARNIEPATGKIPRRPRRKDGIDWWIIDDTLVIPII